MTASLRIELPPDAYHDTPWTLVLPWLATHTAGSLRDLTELAPSPDWWLTESPAVTTMAASHDDVCTALSRVLLASYPEAPFSDLLPTLPRRLPLAALPLGSRARTTLQRLQAHIVGDLAGRSVRDLFDVRGTGQGTVEEITAGLIGAAITRQTTPYDDTETVRDRAAPPTALPPAHAQVLEDLTQLSRWRHTRDASDEPLLTVDLEDSTPEELQDLVRRLNAVTATDIAPRQSEPDPVADITALMSRLDERQLLILRERFLASEPKTLDELATVTGVSRERVRQVEAAVKELLMDTFHYGTTVGDMLASLRVEIQPVAALTRLTDRHPDLSRTVPDINVPLWFVLDKLDDYFEVVDGWAVAPDIATAREHTRTLLEDYADEHGVVEPAALATSTVALSDGEMRDWLTWCGYLYHDGRVLTRVRSAGDHAAAVLSVAGTPLALEEIVDRMATGRNPRTVANALADDDRFVRTDRATWGLNGWDIEAYAGIRNEIGRLLEANPEGLPLSSLIENITGRFSVSPLSVQAYASNRDHQIVDGIVKIRDHPATPRKDPADTRRLYRQGDTWRLRINITGDHLRGSGFPVPLAVAGILGCRPGNIVELVSRLGTQPIRWTGMQPSSGTIKRFLDQMDIQEGHQVFLEFLPDGGFDVKSLHEPGTLHPLQQALLLTGTLPPDNESDQVSALAQAVGLTADAKPRQILSTYDRRGDDDIVVLLEAAWTRPRTDSQHERSSHPPAREEGRADIDSAAGGPASGGTGHDVAYLNDGTESRAEWVPVPDGYRSVGWIRPVEAQAVVDAYLSRGDIPVRKAGAVTAWARYREPRSVDDHDANVQLVRTRSDGERPVCWLRRNEATAIIQAERRGRTTPVSESGGGWTGLVQYFPPGSSEAQRFRSTTRLLRGRRPRYDGAASLEADR